MEPQIAPAYKNAKKRLFITDYDGVLAELKPTPLEAMPTPEILDTLRALANDPKNTVVVISGRRHQELEEWLGGLPIAFAGEHGLMYKELGQDWAITKYLDTSWKPAVRAVMETYVPLVTGSLIEDKTNALVWHSRNADDPRAAAELEKELAAKLLPYGAQHDLRVMLGSKIVEVQPNGVNKGLAARHWLDQDGWDFIFCAGDDTTDEDMFKIMPPDAFTFRVGGGDTLARYRLNGPADTLKLLHSLTVS